MCSDWVPPSTAASASIGGPDDVVERLLGGQADARGLGVEAHLPRAGVLRAEGLAHLPRPDPPRRPVLGDLLEEVDLGVEEERQARREIVDVQSPLDGLLDIGQAVLEREGELLLGGRARLADVVAGDRDRMPARHPRVHHSIMSPHRRIAGSIGKHHSFWAMYSLRMSAWIVPDSCSGAAG